MLRGWTILAVGFLVLGPSSADAQAASVHISVNFNGTKVEAAATGTAQLLKGTGKIGPYTMRVTAGSIIVGRYVRLSGLITAGNTSIPFNLVADRTTGSVKMYYTGARGTPVVLTGKGAVSIR